MVPLSAPPALHETEVHCIQAAAAHYQVPPAILLALAEKEGGKPGLWVRNANGSYDVGSMQFNTRYLKELAPYGIKPADVAAQGCYAFELAAWRLRHHLLKDKGDVFTKAANYHSKTLRFNQIYRADLMKKAGRWQHWLHQAISAQKTSPTDVRIEDRVVYQQPPQDLNQAAARALAAVFAPHQQGGQL